MIICHCIIKTNGELVKVTLPGEKHAACAVHLAKLGYKLRSTTKQQSVQIIMGRVQS